jgi:subtilisin-like proprotein convertase family protein
MQSPPRGSRRAAATALFAIVFGIGASVSAHAQYAQICLALNETGPGNEYLEVPYKSELQGHLAYTIEAWVHPTSFAGNPTIIGNDYRESFWLGLNTAGQVRFYPRGGAGQFVETAVSVPLNAWTHIAAVYNAWVGHSIYINGELASSGTGSGLVGSSAGDLRIGADREAGAPAYFWRGYLDEIRIWSVARTVEEIRATMYVGTGRPANFGSGVYDGLKASWIVEGPTPTYISSFGESSTAIAWFVNGDYSTHTTFNAPFGPPVAPNVALQLNGVDDRAVIPVTEDFDRGITVMAWIAPATVAGFPTIAGRDFTQSFWLGLNTGGRLRFYPTGLTSVEGVEVISTNRWTHVAATYDPAQGRTVLYVNGRVDVISQSISGPVGANGRDVWIGADNGASGLGFPFSGLLDEVKIVQGVLSAPEVRRQMYLGYAGFVNPHPVNDQDGVSVSLYHASFDGHRLLDVLGSSARLVRGGTAAAQIGCMNISLRPIQNYALALMPLSGTSLPDNDISTSVVSNIFWPVPQLVWDVDVFLSAPLTALGSTQIRLRSPAGTWVTLLSYQEALGRDLLTVFDDAPWLVTTWASGYAPFHTGVRPSEPLSTFTGEEAYGQWQLEIEAAPGSDARVGLWAWGIRVNHLLLDVPAATLARPALRLAGPNPLRGAGSLAFDLPHPARVDLGLYDLQGRHVLPIVGGRRDAGSYHMNFSAAALAPGVYLASLKVDGAEVQTLKLTIVK